MFDTIVVGVDGSPHAERAVQVAGQLARAVGDKVVVIHERETYPGGGIGPVVIETLADATKLVDGYVDELTEAGVAATGEVHRAMNSRVGHALLEQVERHSAGLLVVGTRGCSDVTSLVLGSVAHDVVHLAHLPVLVVPDQKR
jgi:nucleotide-binding universal stress UspA family protein